MQQQRTISTNVILSIRVQTRKILTLRSRLYKILKQDNLCVVLDVRVVRYDYHRGGS